MDTGPLRIGARQPVRQDSAPAGVHPAPAVGAPDETIINIPPDSEALREEGAPRNTIGARELGEGIIGGGVVAAVVWNIPSATAVAAGIAGVGAAGLILGGLYVAKKIYSRMNRKAAKKETSPGAAAPPAKKKSDKLRGPGARTLTQNLEVANRALRLVKRGTPPDQS